MSVQLRSRNVIRTFNVLTFAVAAIAVALRVPHDPSFARPDVRILVGAAIVLVAIAVRYSVPLLGMRGKRQTAEDSASLDLPITLSLFIVAGGAAAALATLIGSPLSRLLRRRVDWLALAFGESLENALARADRALYAAKRSGRNKVVELTA